jgi:hypothetical protein
VVEQCLVGLIDPGGAAAQGQAAEARSRGAGLEVDERIRGCEFDRGGGFGMRRRACGDAGESQEGEEGAAKRGRFYQRINSLRGLRPRPLSRIFVTQCAASQFGDHTDGLALSRDQILGGLQNVVIDIERCSYA